MKKVTLSDSGLKWSGVGGRNDAYTAEGQSYLLDLQFFKPINGSDCSWKRLDKNFKITIIKKDEGPHWPHLLSTSKKLEEGNMRIDWTRWDLEDTRDEEKDEVDEPRGKKAKKGKKKRRKKEL